MVHNFPTSRFEGGNKVQRNFWIEFPEKSFTIWFYADNSGILGLILSNVGLI